MRDGGGPPRAFNTAALPARDQDRDRDRDRDRDPPRATAGSRGLSSAAARHRLRHAGTQPSPPPCNRHRPPVIVTAPLRGSREEAGNGAAW